MTAACEIVTHRVSSGSTRLHAAVRNPDAETSVVLVHGFPDTSKVWDPVAERLAERFRVITYDVRGAGGSDHPVTTPEYALSFLTNDFGAVIDQLSPDRPVHLVGHDWGSIQGWEFATSPSLQGRLLSYTSISGPPLDHVGAWTRKHRYSTAGLDQAVHSWYIAAFHLPGLPQLAERLARSSSPQMLARWRKALQREGAPVDEGWPAATFPNDFVSGTRLYRANIRQRLRHPGDRHAEIPVRLLVALQDRYVTPALLDGLQSWSPEFTRTEIDGPHWLPRSHPDQVSAEVTELIESCS